MVGAHFTGNSIGNFRNQFDMKIQQTFKIITNLIYYQLYVCLMIMTSCARYRLRFEWHRVMAEKMNIEINSFDFHHSGKSSGNCSKIEIWATWQTVTGSASILVIFWGRIHIQWPRKYWVCIWRQCLFNHKKKYSQYSHMKNFLCIKTFWLFIAVRLILFDQFCPFAALFCITVFLSFPSIHFHSLPSFYFTFLPPLLFYVSSSSSILPLLISFCQRSVRLLQTFPPH